MQDQELKVKNNQELKGTQKQMELVIHTTFGEQLLCQSTAYVE